MRFLIGSKNYLYIDLFQIYEIGDNSKTPFSNIKNNSLTKQQQLSMQLQNEKERMRQNVNNIIQNVQTASQNQEDVLAGDE